MTCGARGPTMSMRWAVAHTWHWDGSAWTALPGVPGGRHVTGSGPNDVWLARDVRAGCCTSTEPAGRASRSWHRRPIAGLVAIAPDDVWAIVHRALDVRSSSTSTASPGRTSFQHTDPTSEMLEALGALGDRRRLAGRFDVDRPGGDARLSEPLRRANVAARARRPEPAHEREPCRRGGDHRRGTRRRRSCSWPPRPRPDSPICGPGPRRFCRACSAARRTDMWAVGDAGTVLALRRPRGQRGGGADQRQPAGRVGQRPERRLDGRHGRHGAALRRAIIHARRVGHDRRLEGGVHGAPRRCLDRRRRRHAAALGRQRHVRRGARRRRARRRRSSTSTVLAPSDIWLSGGGPVFNGAVRDDGSFVSHFDGTSWSPVERCSDSSEFGGHASRANESGSSRPTTSGSQTSSAHQYGFNGYWHFDGVTWTGEASTKTSPASSCSRTATARASSSARTTAGWST